MPKNRISLLLTLMLTLSASFAFGNRVSKEMSWAELKSSGKINILNDKIEFGDALGHKMSIFNVCRTEDGNFASVAPRRICDEARTIGRSGPICESSDYRIVRFENKFVDYVCASPQCDTRQRLVKKLAKTISLAVYSRGEGRQGPYHQFLFNKQYTIPSCY